jgi:hypothetical protein
MLGLLVYGSDPELRRAVGSLWPFGTRPLDAIRTAVAPPDGTLTAGGRAPR